MPWDDVDRARLDLELPDRRHRIAGRVTRTQDELGRLHERVVTPGHRRRAGVARDAVEADHPPVVAGDPADDAQRPAGVKEPPALLDVQLQERAGQLPVVGLASLAAGLLGAEDDDAERAVLRADP